MKNSSHQYLGINEMSLLNRSSDENLSRDLARADDDGFAIAKNNSQKQDSAEDLDCWDELRQNIKVGVFRFLRIKNKI